MSNADIKKQVEYYLGDANLAVDDFFRDIISQNKDGFIDIAVILKCNKIKKLGVNSAKQIIDACKDSTNVETSKDGTKIRRMKNAVLPEKTGSLKKREAKLEEKKAAKDGDAAEAKEEVNDPVQRDDQGRIIFCQQDFENTLIVHFKTEDVDAAQDEDYKVSWKDLENVIKTKFDQIKVVYSRADKYEGDLAISRHKLNRAQYDELVQLKDQLIGTKKFSFAETEGEELKDFWQKQGGHFQYCIAPKLRLARKN
jgi:hypothetical protein